MSTTYSVNTTNTTHRLGRIFAGGVVEDTFTNYRYFARCSLSGVSYPSNVPMETSDGSITRIDVVPAGTFPDLGV